MKILLLLALCAFVSFARAQTNVDAAQLTGWQNFFDKTNGAGWTRCRNKRDNPCTCEGGSANVTCTEVDGTLFITSVRLRNNGLSGVNVPGSELEAIVGGYSGFTLLDISQNPNLKNTRGGCIRIPSCTTGTATCTVGYPVCANAGTASPSTAGAPTTAGSTTTAPTPGVTVPGATAWRRFFDATNGLRWTRCSATRQAPCDCQRNQVATAPIKVVCTGSSNVITRISMINNNLTASTFPATDVGDLIRAGAAYIDLTGNPGLAPNEACFNVPECNNGGVICVLPKPLCSTSLSPATTPTTLNTPTSSPSSPGSGTVAPSSASPTATAVPATESPSSVNTAAPTTSTPGTSSPSIFLPPSVPTTSTKSPTVQPGTTGSPTPSQTISPSSTGTNSPTPAPVTKSPTSPVQATTGSPTQSSSNTVDGCRVAAAIIAISLTALAF